MAGTCKKPWKRRIIYTSQKLYNMEPKSEGLVQMIFLFKWGGKFSFNFRRFIFGGCVKNHPFFGGTKPPFVDSVVYALISYWSWCKHGRKHGKTRKTCGQKIEFFSNSFMTNRCFSQKMAKKHIYLEHRCSGYGSYFVYLSNWSHIVRFFKAWI